MVLTSVYDSATGYTCHLLLRAMPSASMSLTPVQLMFANARPATTTKDAVLLLLLLLLIMMTSVVTVMRLES